MQVGRARHEGAEAALPHLAIRRPQFGHRRPFRRTETISMMQHGGYEALPDGNIDSMSIDVVVTEVGPRDGLQSVRRAMPTRAKHRWIEALAKAGLREIEVGSFVSPK